MLESLLIVFLAGTGFILAFFLFNKKRQKDAVFICPLRGNCSEVIHSSYSKFLGIPVERLGVAYYFLMLVGYALLVVEPELFGWMKPYLLIVSSLAFLFSLYLTFIQIVFLRKICTWCLCSAGISMAIFFLSVMGGLEIILPILMEYRSGILIAHVLFMALGLGAATLTDIFFFRFLKDQRISQEESEILSTLSEFIWFALSFIVLTGLALYLPQAAHYHDVPKFLAKVVVVGVILVNGAFLNLYIAPKLSKISFGEPHHHKEGELNIARRLAFALGPISVVSWYSAFILGSLPASTPLSFTMFLKIYLLLLVGAVAIGQFTERRLSKTPLPWTEPS
jgi:uncharacterized membrane protein